LKWIYSVLEKSSSYVEFPKENHICSSFGFCSNKDFYGSPCVHTHLNREKTKYVCVNFKYFGSTLFHL